MELPPWCDFCQRPMVLTASPGPWQVWLCTRCGITLDPEAGRLLVAWRAAPGITSISS